LSGSQQTLDNLFFNLASLGQEKPGFLAFGLAGTGFRPGSGEF
jgi:hypothetical protein